MLIMNESEISKHNSDMNASELFSYNLKKYRKQKKLSMDKLAEDLNKKYGTKISKSMISRWETGVTDPQIKYVLYLADYFQISLTNLIGRRARNAVAHGARDIFEPHPSNSIDTSGMHYVRVPIIGTIACGEPILAEQNIEGYTHELFEEEPKKDELFALRCKGDSMEPLIPDGALVLIHKQPTVEDDEIAAVQVDDDTRATLKKIKHVGQNVILYPINSKYDPIILNKDNPGRILGKAIHVGFDM
ncbi:peptidase S24-like protein [Lactobacillus hominis DSM 23910 = CRBIP 24.179]|nr:peptidase S24-like protein [Lactobacillus hominis DSM 23910 = CRBIP 24.179]